MNRPADDKARTHNAYAFKRETRVSGKWLEIGNARVEFDLETVPEQGRPMVLQLLRSMRCHVFLDRTPIGGFSGHVFITPIGEKPPVPRSQAPQAERQPDPLEDEV